MALYEVTITETRKRKVYVEKDYDFEAESDVEHDYVCGHTNLNDDVYIDKWFVSVKEVQ